MMEEMKKMWKIWQEKNGKRSLVWRLEEEVDSDRGQAHALPPPPHPEDNSQTKDWSDEGESWNTQMEYT